MNPNFSAFPCSSLEKILVSRKAPEVQELKTASCLKNEVFSYQVVYYMSVEGSIKLRAEIEVESDIKDYIHVRSVGHVACELPAFNTITDDDYISTEPGLFPDPLNELDNALFMQGGYYKSLWITVSPNAADIPAGTHPIKIIFKNIEDDTLIGSCDFSLKVIDKRLPDQKLIHTEWFYCDCIADYYKIEVFSEKFWEYTRNFIRTAVKNGINMILTPVFTPPLDTLVGAERTTVQLVDVHLENNQYRFNFDKLQKWFDMCSEEGVKYYEIAHFFTQWGAKCAPKIMGWKDGVYQKLFGWETDSIGPEYSGFLKAFIPALIKVIEENKLESNVYFHISDEPRPAHLEQYKAARDIVSGLLENYKIIDALSSYEFYEKGIVTHPIPASNHIEPFLENKVPDLWTYYCCSQGREVSNRFIAMPSSRNRIIGTQLFKYDIAGFLHWGYNFYNSRLSVKQINPFAVPDAGFGFPAGDPFLVYPGEDGNVVESVRIVVFNEALQDLRAFELLAQYKGKDFVVKLIEDGLDYGITFKQYPKGSNYLLDLRERVNKILETL